MARMSNNEKCLSRNFSDSQKLTNCILDYGATCHMTPEVQGFIPGSLEYTDKHIQVAEGHHITVGVKGQVRIKMCDDNGDTFIATLHYVLLAPDICNRLFSIVVLMNQGHTCLFQKGFCTVYFREKDKIRLTCHIVQKGNMHFGGK